MTLPQTAPAAGEGGATRPYLTLVMPAFNEAARLPAGLDRVIAFLRAQPFDAEIVVADDGSTDATAAIVRGRAIDMPGNVTLKLVQNARNLGKGAAIRTGVLAARGRYIFYLDADLATPPEDALKLLAVLEGGVPVAIGTRIQPDGSDMRASQPAQRRLAGRLFTFMRKAMRVLPDIDDTQCPMKGFDQDVAREVFQRQRLSGWIFDAELLYVARSLGFRIVSVPVTWRHVDGSRLRVRPTQAWQVLRDLMRLRFLHRASAAPAARP